MSKADSTQMANFSRPSKAKSPDRFFKVESITPVLTLQTPASLSKTRLRSFPPRGSSLSHRMICHHCRQIFKSRSGYNYHTKMNICQRVPPGNTWNWSCQYCYQGFVMEQGKDYHEQMRICLRGHSTSEKATGGAIESVFEGDMERPTTV